jgi:type IV pilus assembly protein PilB
MVSIKRMISKQLGELLIERDVITKAQLDKALAAQKAKGGLLGEILVGLGYVKEEDIAQVIAMQYGFPYLPLESYEINPDIVRLIPEDVAKEHNLIAIDRIEDLVTIAMSNPLNEKAVKEVEAVTKCDVQIFIATMTDVRNAIKRYYVRK